MKNLKRVLALVTVFAMVMSVSAFAAEWWYDATPEEVTENVTVQAAVTAIETTESTNTVEATIRLDGDSSDGSG